MSQREIVALCITMGDDDLMLMEDSSYKATPRVEQETVLNFDRGLDVWFVSTDIPKHIRKYLPYMEKGHFKASKDSLGNIVYLEGRLSEDALVSVRKKAKLSEEQKRASAERLAAGRKKD